MDNPGRQYYHPNLTAAEERALLRRNYLVLMTGQAALGLIAEDMLGIAVEGRPDTVVLHFAVTTRTAEIDEDIDDIAFELRTFFADGPEQHSPITSRVHVGQPDATWPGRSHALTYLAKPQGE